MLTPAGRRPRGRSLLVAAAIQSPLPGPKERRLRQNPELPSLVSDRALPWGRGLASESGRAAYPSVVRPAAFATGRRHDHMDDRRSDKRRRRRGDRRYGPWCYHRARYCHLRGGWKWRWSDVDRKRVNARSWRGRGFDRGSGGRVLLARGRTCEILVGRHVSIHDQGAGHGDYGSDARNTQADAMYLVHRWSPVAQTKSTFDRYGGHLLWPLDLVDYHSRLREGNHRGPSVEQRWRLRPASLCRPASLPGRSGARSFHEAVGFAHTSKSFSMPLQGAKAAVLARGGRPMPERTPPRTGARAGRLARPARAGARGARRG